jgi:hypothetical protein
MKGHGKENVLALHAHEPRHRIANGEGARMPGMQISIEIRIRYG